MKIKTSELTGAALDWAVAEALKPMLKHPENFYIDTFGPLFGKGFKAVGWRGRLYTPSTDWKEGGPIIEREGISVYADWRGLKGRIEQWIAELPIGGVQSAARPTGRGPTPLIAAMRCYVAPKLGDEVEVSDELQ